MNWRCGCKSRHSPNPINIMAKRNYYLTNLSVVVSEASHNTACGIPIAVFNDKDTAITARKEFNKLKEFDFYKYEKVLQMECRERKEYLLNAAKTRGII